MMRQSKDALPQDMTELNMALTIKLFVLLYTKYIAAEHNPAEKVANTAKEITILVLRNELFFTIYQRVSCDIINFFR